MANEGMTYKDAGVDIESMNIALARIKNVVQSTSTPPVLSEMGAFGGMFKADFASYRQPVLVATIDGVGTKVRIARMMNSYETIGRDIVCHSINDLLVQAAKPLFFLDYFATARLEPEVLIQVVEGAAMACLEHGIALLGGETAEMPDVYMPGEIDLAGCMIGVAEREQIPTPAKVSANDAVIGIASNGLHTNGYTLARRVLFDTANMRLDEYLPEMNMILGEALLLAHRAYLRSVFPLIEDGSVYAMAHITGGGLYDNLPRVLPIDCRVVIDRRSWEVPPLFQLIQRVGNISDPEMFRTFNMGIGFVLVVSRERVSRVIDALQAAHETAWLLGEVQRGTREVQII
jgi:phosphoribosylformylglycinamidine cyclo-ligase